MTFLIKEVTEQGCEVSNWFVQYRTAKVIGRYCTPSRKYVSGWYFTETFNEEVRGGYRFNCPASLGAIFLLSFHP